LNAIRFVFAVVLVAWFAVAGCASGNSKSGSAGSAVSKSVGAAGGTVTASDGSGVTVPPGALSGDTNISVTASPDAPAPKLATVIGPAYTFGPEGQTFAKPVTVTLAFDAGKIPSGRQPSDIAIFTAPAGTATYVKLVTRVVDGSHVAADTTHFSTFVAVMPNGCVVTCGDSYSGSDSGGTALDGCGCHAFCNPDGTPGTGSCSGSTGGGTVCTGTGVAYAMECRGGTCVCKTNEKPSGTPTTTAVCGGDAISSFEAFVSCGFPGIYEVGGGSGGSGGGSDAGSGDTEGGLPDAGNDGGTPNPCTPMFTSGSMCQGHSQCNGHSYDLVCDGANCQCLKDGMATTSFGEGSTCSNAMMQWSVTCMFPTM